MAATEMNWPITIIWPGDTPETALPDSCQRLGDGHIEAVYHNVAELRESVYALTLIAEAKAMATLPAGVRVHCCLEDFFDYLTREKLQVVGEDWRPSLNDPTRLTLWVGVAPV